MAMQPFHTLYPSSISRKTPPELQASTLHVPAMKLQDGVKGQRERENFSFGKRIRRPVAAGAQGARCFPAAPAASRAAPRRAAGAGEEAVCSVPRRQGEEEGAGAACSVLQHRGVEAGVRAVTPALHLPEGGAAVAVGPRLQRAPTLEAAVARAVPPLRLPWGMGEGER